jgi:hypothetical protein
MRASIRPAVSLALLAASWACARSPDARAPEGEAAIRGPVERITSHATATGILVSAPINASGNTCALLAIADGKTRFLRRRGENAFGAAKLADLSEGDTVEVFVEEPVKGSCVLQGNATAVVIDAKHRLLEPIFSGGGR